ncbi:hypothetical protein TrRE_jg1500, partial [Triparma retinervis]
LTPDEQLAVFKDIFGKPLEHYKKEEMQKYIPAMCAWWDASIHISTNNDLVPESLTYKDFWSFPPMTDEQFMKSIEVTKRPPPVMKEGEIEEKAGSAPGKGGKKGTGKYKEALGTTDPMTFAEGNHLKSAHSILPTPPTTTPSHNGGNHLKSAHSILPTPPTPTPSHNGGRCRNPNVGRRRNPRYDYRKWTKDQLAEHLASDAFAYLLANFPQDNILDILVKFCHYTVGELGKYQPTNTPQLRDAWTSPEYRLSSGIYSAAYYPQVDGGAKRARELQKELHLDYVVPKLIKLYEKEYGGVPQCLEQAAEARRWYGDGHYKQAGRESS